MYQRMPNANDLSRSQRLVSASDERDKPRGSAGFGLRAYFDSTGHRTCRGCHTLNSSATPSRYALRDSVTNWGFRAVNQSFSSTRVLTDEGQTQEFRPCPFRCDQRTDLAPQINYVDLGTYSPYQIWYQLSAIHYQLFPVTQSLLPAGYRARQCFHRRYDREQARCAASTAFPPLE